ncbi:MULTISPECIES: hypothetical protein [unclassified Microbulbifer]|uniref:hypothetical protein n=1 Tax=unclassified Microbulbifer TaxID=2619833 RepID=UPI0027E53FCA|nr:MULTISPECIES: hypothetical protein [unclassified Microbulbifer]
MKIESSWVFDCLPEDIYPNFFHATMDDSYPLAFRLGIPKPLSCKVLEGEPKIGNTRQCTTDKGYIRQNIVELEENRKLVYQMKESDVWCKNWVSFLQDSFILEPIENNKTKVTRITVFHGVKNIPILSTVALWFSLKQAHKYASKNWRRLATCEKSQRTGQAYA